MINMFNLFAIVAIFLFGLNSGAQTESAIPYIPMKRCDPKPFDSYRQSWDRSGQFCFVQNGKTYRYPITDLGEVKLREDGKTIANAFTAQLSQKSLAEISKYEKFFVRYLSIEDVSQGVRPFVVHVFFKWGPGTQTMYVLGEISQEGRVRLTGFSNADGSDGDIRAAWNTLTNLGAVLSGKNPNREGVNLTKAEDRARSVPAREVVQKYIDDKRTSPSPITINP